METTYTYARENLASLLDLTVNDKEIVIIKRRNNQSVALIAADELASLMETAYLLRSPKNAERLLQALDWSQSRDNQSVVKQDPNAAIALLKRELGIEQKEETGTT